MPTTDSDEPSLYHNRPLAAGHPDIQSHELAAKLQQPANCSSERTEDILTYVGRAVDLSKCARRAAVVGCGPTPMRVQRLAEFGWDCVGVEPVREFVICGRRHLSNGEAVRLGSAEDLPLPNQSCDLILLESVLEHVDSPVHALSEAYRVLAPGGVLYVTTTNRLSISNNEYTVPLFQWFPKTVKESYIHQHLHFKPSLARYTSRPAVHWFTYADLCALGRDAGFYRFYSKIDLMHKDDPAVRKSRLRIAAIKHMRRNPWLRSIALTQKGGSILMLKRPHP